MGSHRDLDSPIPFAEGISSEEIAEKMESLRKRAERLTVNKQNEITAGQDGERVLFESVRRGVLIRRLEDDPDGVLRISIGEALYAAGSAYCIFRGSPESIERLLQKALRAVRRSING